MTPRRTTRGERGTAVAVWQAFLTSKGYKLPSSTLPDGSFDGIHGKETELMSRAYEHDQENAPPPCGYQGAFDADLPIDDWASKELADGKTCISPRRGALAFPPFVLRNYGGGDLGIARECSAPGNSEHEEGRAWDWGIVKGAALNPEKYRPAMVEKLLADFLANDGELCRRAGVMYFIYNQRIFRAYDPRGWAKYHGKDPHTGHIHFSLSNAGGDGLTTLYKQLERTPFFTL